ncbi:unnamed protein product [Paramecium sonneborni]|uniref:Uncharacterized protein n=1 Tax=Paramecium sonneborni TaxID=65129 RepID=A0A8S1NPK8_9CILI|nr:unnamed protein product [Paramecium sonneborni]
MDKNKKDIMNLINICQHHKMYKYYQYLNMFYKYYDKLSNYYQLVHNDQHMFNIQRRMCKQHINFGKNFGKQVQQPKRLQTQHPFEQALHYKNTSVTRYPGLHVSQIKGYEQLQQFDAQSRHEPSNKTQPYPQLQVTIQVDN